MIRILSRLTLLQNWQNFLLVYATAFPTNLEHTVLKPSTNLLERFQSTLLVKSESAQTVQISEASCDNADFKPQFLSGVSGAECSRASGIQIRQDGDTSGIFLNSSGVWYSHVNLLSTQALCLEFVFSRTNSDFQTFGCLYADGLLQSISLVERSQQEPGLSARLLPDECSFEAHYSEPPVGVYHGKLETVSADFSVISETDFRFEPSQAAEFGDRNVYSLAADKYVVLPTSLQALDSTTGNSMLVFETFFRTDGDTLIYGRCRYSGGELYDYSYGCLRRLAPLAQEIPLFQVQQFCNFKAFERIGAH